MSYKRRGFFDGALVRVFCVLVASLTLLAATAEAKDYGRVGVVFEIEEQDILDMIRSKLGVMEQSGELDRLNEELARRTEAGVRRPPRVAGISVATRERAWLYDPSIVVPDDYADHRGVVFARKGTRINPLSTMVLSREYLFVDGDDSEQIGWAVSRYREVEGKALVILVGGAPLDLMDKHQMRFYFDQAGHLTSRFGILAVPASVNQEGNLIRVREHVVKSDGASR